MTVLGEVGRRGIISTTKDRLSIIEAIGQAGDISDFGNRSNVLLIREENGKREIARLNLLTVDIFNSPYYYLKQNDIIYVEPDRRKSINLSSNQTNRIVSLVTSVTSLTALLIALFGT
ncbi:MAG: polysaccharide biosynthesis/export family protein [Saprospiraceae bacterium]